MPANESGRQSPPPENQTGAQQQDAPGSGAGVQDISNSDKKSQQNDQLKDLASNPKGSLEDAAAEKASKDAK